MDRRSLLVLSILLYFCDQGMASALPATEFPWFVNNQNRVKDPDEMLDVCQLIESKGYKCETYTVQTHDGYLLGLQRIPNGINVASAQEKRPVAFLQHGLLGSATNWVENLPHQSLGFILADNGFDVWLGNIRGSTYSRNHTTLRPNQPEFWDFSLDEHALIDLPEQIEYALKISGQEKVHYVGHSQGSMMGLALASKNQTIAKKMHAIYLLAPVVRPANVQGLAKLAANSISVEMMDKAVNSGMFEAGEVFPVGVDVFVEYAQQCKTYPEECHDMMNQLMGNDIANLNITRYPVYLGNNPAGTSAKNLKHWKQLTLGSVFQMYDYGPEENMVRYKQKTPPAYEPKEITVPIAIFSGSSDFLSTPEDVAWLHEQLGDRVFYSQILSNWEHMSFVWGVNAYSELYSTILDLMRS